MSKCREDRSVVRLEPGSEPSQLGPANPHQRFARSTPSRPVVTNLLRDFHLHPRPPHGNEFERDADSRGRGENDDVGYSRRLRRLLRERKRKRKGDERVI